MKIVQDALIDNLINYMDELIFRGKVKLNGNYVNYDIFKTVKKDNIIRKYLYLETETGFVEEAQLLSSMGEVLAIKPFEINKLEDGLVIAFEFAIIVKEPMTAGEDYYGISKNQLD